MRIGEIAPFYRLWSDMLVSALAVGRSSILSSGTVGAAIEASLMGVRGIALSFPFTKGFNNWTDDEVASMNHSGCSLARSPFFVLSSDRSLVVLSRSP